MHALIISLRGKVWAHITSLTPPHVIEVPVSRQESERSCIGVLGVSGIVFLFIRFCDSILELSRQCGIFIFLDFGTVPTVWYFCFSIFWNCSDSMVFLFFYILELSRQCGIFVFLYFETVPTVWYFCFSRFWNCPDSVVFLFF